MNNQQHLKKKIESQIKRIKKAEHDRPNLLSQTVYIGTLGLVMVLPIIGGVYLGALAGRYGGRLLNALDAELIVYRIGYRNF